MVCSEVKMLEEEEEKYKKRIEYQEAERIYSAQIAKYFSPPVDKNYIDNHNSYRHWNNL